MQYIISILATARRAPAGSEMPGSGVFRFPPNTRNTTARLVRGGAAGLGAASEMATGGAARASAPDKLRKNVALTREDATENESMRNLAYVVSSANDNIQALQRTVKQQETELGERADHASALQRNYETLARIRQADQKEFLALKTQQAEEREQLQQLRAQLSSERGRCAELEAKLQQSASAQSDLHNLQLRLTETIRERDEHAAEAAKARGAASEMGEHNKVLKVNIDKLSRLQQEMLARSKKVDETVRSLESERDCNGKEKAAALSKCSVQERQLKTFLQANEALEADLRKQMARVQALERRKAEQEAELQTVEAYYQARLDEMNAQYNKLLGEIDDAKRVAQQKVYSTFNDDAPVLPAGGAVPDAAPPSPGGRSSPRK